VIRVDYPSYWPPLHPAAPDRAAPFCRIPAAPAADLDAVDLVGRPEAARSPGPRWRGPPSCTEMLQNYQYRSGKPGPSASRLGDGGTGGPAISPELALSSVAFLHGAACSDCGCAGAGGSGRLVIQRSRRKTRSQVCGQGFPERRVRVCGQPCAAENGPRPRQRRALAALRAGAGRLAGVSLLGGRRHPASSGSRTAPRESGPPRIWMTGCTSSRWPTRAAAGQSRPRGIRRPPG
jgi:hypothetical protein